MQIKRRKKHHVGIESGSLSDILFFLLLFFLMISTMASPEAIKLLLPKADKTEKVPPTNISVAVDAAYKWYIDGKELEPASFENSLKTVAATHDNNVTVVIKMDKDVKVEELVKVVDAVNKLDLPVVMATSKN